MFVDDINISYHLLSEIQHVIDSVYQVIRENNIIKKNAQSVEKCRDCIIY